ncbi:MAG: aldo/keto reductase [Cyanobacteriota bacterium]|nr:aldo/keto reductase [Cyanobacteriota bacterium]
MLPTRRFGRTGLAMPVLSLGGMRYQQSWSDLPAAAITAASQDHLREVLQAAVAAGFHHIETARGYGTSERQLGELLPLVPDPRRILQTKVAPEADPERFAAQLALSFERLAVERVDLLGLHGINTPDLLEQTLRPGGCLEVVRHWQAEGRIGHVGFSTHAPLPVILEAIASDAFAYINLHWYYIKQENSPALEAARAHDMGVFLISPTDKGGHLHTPSERLVELCAPHHPIVVNDLFCLGHPAVHTISVGAARVSDLQLHLQAAALLEEAPSLLPPVLERLEAARVEALGGPWLASWREGLPAWEDTPGQINVPVLLWLHNLLAAWDLEDFCQGRYRLLGNGGHWFPGENADALDQTVSEEELLAALAASPWAERIPDLLRELRRRLGGGVARRLQVS